MQMFVLVCDDGDLVGKFGWIENFLFVVVDILDVGQDVFFFGDFGKIGFVEQDFGEDYGCYVVGDQCCVDW